MTPIAEVLTLVLAIGSPMAPQRAAPPPLPVVRDTASVSRLGWLAGCWRLRAGTRIVEEQWMAPAGGMMLGMGRTTRDGRVTEFEQLRIFEREGRAVYAASPSGQAPAEFVAGATSDTLVAFENPAHDFPQRVIYRRSARDSVTARVEGTVGGKQRSTEFRYGRATCPEHARDTTIEPHAAATEVRRLAS